MHPYDPPTTARDAILLACALEREAEIRADQELLGREDGDPCWTQREDDGGG